jgi:hypothetical protein
MSEVHRLRVSLKRQSALHINRIALNDAKLVYVICANKAIRYQNGRSPIAYIGTTQNGIDRVAPSAAGRAYDILGEHGITALDVRIVTTTPRQRIKSWKVLERAMLLQFREMFGEVPFCNTVGKGMKESNEFDIFARDRIRQIIADLTESGMASGSAIEGND